MHIQGGKHWSLFPVELLLHWCFKYAFQKGVNETVPVIEEYLGVGVRSLEVLPRHHGVRMLDYCRVGELGFHGYLLDHFAGVAFHHHQVVVGLNQDAQVGGLFEADVLFDDHRKVTEGAEGERHLLAAYVIAGDMGYLHVAAGVAAHFVIYFNGVDSVAVVQ